MKFRNSNLKSKNKKGSRKKSVMILEPPKNEKRGSQFTHMRVMPTISVGKMKSGSESGKNIDKKLNNKSNMNQSSNNSFAVKVRSLKEKEEKSSSVPELSELMNNSDVSGILDNLAKGTKSPAKDI